MTSDTFDMALFSAEVRKQFGEEAIRDLEGEVAYGEPGTYIPSSSERLNRALGIGGIPVGRIVEIYGLEGSGKTTLALDFAATAQRMYPKRPVVYCDAENTLNVEYAKAIGVDTSKKRFIICQEAETETALDIAYKAALRNAAIIVVDSVAALTLKSDMESDSSTDARVGGNAKAIRAHLKKMNPVLRQSGINAIYINQITYKPGVVYGSPETTGGGKGLPFFASVRMDVRAGEKQGDKQTGEFWGQTSRVKVVKNKVASPFKTAEFDIIYGKGIDRIGDLVNVAKDLGVIDGTTWLKFGEQKWQGRAAVIAALAADTKLEATLRAAVRAA